METFSRTTKFITKNKHTWISLCTSQMTHWFFCDVTRIFVIRCATGVGPLGARASKLGFSRYFTWGQFNKLNNSLKFTFAVYWSILDFYTERYIKQKEIGICIQPSRLHCQDESDPQSTNSAWNWSFSGCIHEKRSSARVSLNENQAEEKVFNWHFEKTRWYGYEITGNQLMVRIGHQAKFTLETL